MSTNIQLSKEDAKFIRSLKDFDLTMFLSEINEHGWENAERLIPMMRDALDGSSAAKDRGPEFDLEFEPVDMEALKKGLADMIMELKKSALH